MLLYSYMLSLITCVCRPITSTHWTHLLLLKFLLSAILWAVLSLVVHNISLHASRENGRMDQPCCVPPKPFIFVLDTAEFIPCPLQLCLQALNANHSLHQVLVKICILLLQRPKQKKKSWGMVVWNMFYLQNSPYRHKPLPKQWWVFIQNYKALPV